MKLIIKKLLFNIKFLTNHSLIFYPFLGFIIIYFLISDYSTTSNNTISYNNIIYSLGQSILLSISVAFISMLVGIILILINLTKSTKFVKTILDNIFIFPEILYIFILLFLFSPIDIFEFIIILSIIRGYSFSSTLTVEIGEIENKEFINALYSMGLRRFEIIRRHILPIITIPVIIFFLETITWFIVIEFLISFTGIIQIYKNPALGTMINTFIHNKNYGDLYIIVIILYLFVFELSYIVNNIKVKFEVLFKKEI